MCTVLATKLSKRSECSEPTRVRARLRAESASAAKLRLEARDLIAATWHSSAAVGQRGCLLWVESGR